ncbi:MAG: hypothetical protein H0W30_01605 [Gemmatimonadaceae bacterium]|nr:hypothetical protein [Gemmatimonadaceae bacterium]
MRRLFRRTVLATIAWTTLAHFDGAGNTGWAQQSPPIRLNADGDPDFEWERRNRGRGGFRLFGNADVARSAIKSPANRIFNLENRGQFDVGLVAYGDDDDPDLGACCYPTHFRYLDFFWATPPSERAKIIQAAGPAGSGLPGALGAGFNMRSQVSQNGGDNMLPVDATLGAFHSGSASTADRSCLDHGRNGNFGAGFPLLAGSDCPVTWGSLGWRGYVPIAQEVFLAKARTSPSDDVFDFFNYPEGGPSQGVLERQFGSFQTYAFFSDFSRDDLCGTPTTRTYGNVIRPAVQACPAANPTKPGYPLGLEVRIDAFLYGIPALQDIAYYQIIVVNKSDDLYGVGIDYDSLYMGLVTGYFGTGQENQVYYRPELGAVISTGACIQRTGPRGLCNGGRNVAEFSTSRLTQASRGEPYQQGTQAMVILKSPIGDLRNKLFSAPTSPFFNLAGIPATVLDDTITFNHAHMCGFRACAGTVYSTSELNADHMQRQFGMASSTERNVLGARPTSDPTLAAGNSQVAWHTFRSYDWPALPAIGTGPSDFPQRGGFNRWVPGATGTVGKWDYNNDGIQDTLFLDSCSGKAGGTSVNTSCAGIFSDTLPNGFLNAYANVGSTINVGPIEFKAGDTTSFVIAVMGSCCGANDADSVVTMGKLQTAIDHYLNFYLGPEALPKDTIIAVEVIGGNQAFSQVTLRFTETAENSIDPFLLNVAVSTAAPSPGTAQARLLQLNPFLADSLRALGLRFGTQDTTGLTAVGNFDRLFIFKSCDGGNTFTTSANCEPSPATGGPFAALGFLPYATLERDATTGGIPNSFTDPNVNGGFTYTYVVVGSTRGAAFNLQTGSEVAQVVNSLGDTVFVCTLDCTVERIEFAPQLFNALATSGPNVATVYVPASLPAGSPRTAVTVQTVAGPVPAGRLIVTTARSRPLAGDFRVTFYDSVLVTVRDSLDVDARARLATVTTVEGFQGAASVFLESSIALGGIGLNGGTVVSNTITPVISGGRQVGNQRTTTLAFRGLTGILTRGNEPFLVTRDFTANATPESFFSSTAFPGFTIGFQQVSDRAFNTARGEVFTGPDGRVLGPLAIPFARVNVTGSLIQTAGQGGLYEITYGDKLFGPAEPFRLDLANPQATRDAVVASLNARAVLQTGVADSATAAAIGGGVTASQLVAVKLPFEIRNASFGDRPVIVAMRRRTNNNILLGSGQDTITVTVPEDVWIPGDRLILLEDIGTSPVRRVTFNPFIIECPVSPGTRPSCNPVALSTPGATGFVPTLAGTVQSVLFNPVLAVGQEFGFTIAPQPTGTELAAMCAENPSAEACQAQRNSIKDVLVVPNPYVVFTNFGTGLTRPLLFTHVPPRGTVRIYTVSGQFVQQINWVEQDLNDTGDLVWNLQTREGNTVAAGMYLFMITGKDTSGKDLGSHMGKFVIIR